MSNIRYEIERCDPELIKRAATFSAATLHEAAGKKGALPWGLNPLSPDMKVCGPAITINSPSTDNIMLHQALVVAKPGDVIVIEVSGGYEAGYWGDILSQAAIERQINGLIIDGCVRDGNDIVKMGFPVFARGLCIRGTAKNGGGRINHAIKIGDVIIDPGDLVVGDCDGIVVIPKSEVEQVLEKAKQRDIDEERIREELKKGRTTMEIYGWEMPNN